MGPMKGIQTIMDTSVLDSDSTTAVHYKTLAGLMCGISEQKPELPAQITQAVMDSLQHCKGSITSSRILRRTKIAEILNASFGREMSEEFIRLSESAWVPEPRKKAANLAEEPVQPQGTATIATDLPG